MNDVHYIHLDGHITNKKKQVRREKGREGVGGDGWMEGLMD